MVPGAPDRMWCAMVTLQSEIVETSAHRPFQEDLPERMWCAMATKTFTPRDPESRCPEALKAIDGELKALRDKKVWDEDKVVEWKLASAQFPDAHVGSIFPLVGVKNWESMDPKEHRWEGRVVLGGDQSKKEWAVGNL